MAKIDDLKVEVERLKVVKEKVKAVVAALIEKLHNATQVDLDGVIADVKASVDELDTVAVPEDPAPAPAPEPVVEPAPV